MGVLIGVLLMDVKVILVSGWVSNVYLVGGDFCEVMWCVLC